MKVSPATVRRLRTERGWSQEQLALASGLSLRTIQRVEADGSASLETRTSLAGTFGIQLADLAGDANGQGRTAVTALPATSARYRIGVSVAGVAFIPAVFGYIGLLPAHIAWLATASTPVAVASLIYAGLSWYFSGSNISQPRLRRIALALFIFSAIFSVFASMHSGRASEVASAAQIGLLSVLIYFALDFLIARRRNPSRAA